MLITKHGVNCCQITLVRSEDDGGATLFVCSAAAGERCPPACCRTMVIYHVQFWQTRFITLWTFWKHLRAVEKTESWETWSNSTSPRIEIHTFKLKLLKTRSTLNGFMESDWPLPVETVRNIFDITRHRRSRFDQDPGTNILSKLDIPTVAVAVLQKNRNILPLVSASGKEKPKLFSILAVVQRSRDHALRELCLGGDYRQFRSQFQTGWKRQRNDHVPLHVRAFEGSPVPWWRGTRQSHWFKVHAWTGVIERTRWCGPLRRWVERFHHWWVLQHGRGKNHTETPTPRKPTTSVFGLQKDTITHVNLPSVHDNGVARTSTRVYGEAFFQTFSCTFVHKFNSSCVRTFRHSSCTRPYSKRTSTRWAHVHSVFMIPCFVGVLFRINQLHLVCLVQKRASSARSGWGFPVTWLESHPIELVDAQRPGIFFLRLMAWMFDIRQGRQSHLTKKKALLFRNVFANTVISTEKIQCTLEGSDSSNPPFELHISWNFEGRQDRPCNPYFLVEQPLENSKTHRGWSGHRRFLCHALKNLLEHGRATDNTTMTCNSLRASTSHLMFFWEKCRGFCWQLYRWNLAGAMDTSTADSDDVVSVLELIDFPLVGFRSRFELWVVIRANVARLLVDSTGNLPLCGGRERVPSLITSDVRPEAWRASGKAT